MSAWKQRVDGEESPYTPLGPFKLRLPFYHYRFELPDYLQGRGGSCRDPIDDAATGHAV